MNGMGLDPRLAFANMQHMNAAGGMFLGPLPPILGAPFGQLDAWSITPGTKSEKSAKDPWSTATPSNIHKPQPELISLCRQDSVKSSNVQRFHAGNFLTGSKGTYIKQIWYGRNATEPEDPCSWEIASIKENKRPASGSFSTFFSGARLETTSIRIILRKVPRGQVPRPQDMPHAGFAPQFPGIRPGNSQARGHGEGMRPREHSPIRHEGGQGGHFQQHHPQQRPPQQQHPPPPHEQPPLRRPMSGHGGGRGDHGIGIIHEEEDMPHGIEVLDDPPPHEVRVPREGGHGPRVVHAGGNRGPMPHARGGGPGIERLDSPPRVVHVPEDDRLPPGLVNLGGGRAGGDRPRPMRQPQRLDSDDDRQPRHKSSGGGGRPPIVVMPSGRGNNWQDSSVISSGTEFSDDSDDSFQMSSITTPSEDSRFSGIRYKKDKGVKDHGGKKQSGGKHRRESDRHHSPPRRKSHRDSSSSTDHDMDGFVNITHKNSKQSSKSKSSGKDNHRRRSSSHDRHGQSSRESSPDAKIKKRQEQQLRDQEFEARLHKVHYHLGKLDGMQEALNSRGHYHDVQDHYDPYDHYDRYDRYREPPPPPRRTLMERPMPSRRYSRLYYQ